MFAWICYTSAHLRTVKPLSVWWRSPRFANRKKATVKNIFVGNLSFNTTEDELRRAFEPYGLDRVSILTDRETGRSRGFAFVEMANAEEGKRPSRDSTAQLSGRTINVNEARPKAERAGSGGGGRDRGRGR
jgi:RNA recognition motif-containing protein